MDQGTFPSPPTATTTRQPAAADVLADDSDTEPEAVMAASAKLYVLEPRAPYSSANGSKPTAATESEPSLPCDRGMWWIGMPFTQNVNLFYGNDVMYALSGAAWKCLSFLIRETIGYQRATAALTIEAFATGSTKREDQAIAKHRLSRRAVLEALHELATACLIASDASERGRTQVRTYWLLPPAAWQLDLLDDAQTSAESSLVSDGTSAEKHLVQTRRKSSLVGRETSAVSTLVAAQTSAESSLDDAETRLLSAPLIKKERERKGRERKTDAHAPGADAPPGLPPRLPGDRTELLYWTRIMGEAGGKQRLPLLVRLAHEKLGVPDHSGAPAYGRLGKMAKLYGGAGVLVHHIFTAASHHIDGDPLDFLEKVAQRTREEKKPPGAATPRMLPAVSASTAPLGWNTS